MSMKRLIVPLLVLLVLAATPVHAMKVAVLPVEDLSQGRNGVNLPLTEFIRQRFEKKGFSVISTAEMIAFLAKNRIRWLGFMESSHLFQLREEMGVELVICGTVSQRQELPMAAIGMVLTCLRTADSTVIWSEAGGRSKADVSNFLAINEPSSMDDLLPLLADDLLKNWPESIAPATGKQCSLIEKTTLTPRFVKPGDKVQCSVTMCLAAGEEAPSEVLLMVGDDDYLALDEQVENTYTVSWFAPDWSGTFPVSLVLQYPSGAKQVYYVGSYQIDNSAPRLVLNVTGVEMENAVTFKESVVVIPLWQAPEPVSRWTFKATNRDGETVASSEGSGNLPNRFAWRGKRQDGRRADDGVYEIIVQVWDRADNLATATRKVMLRNNPPRPTIAAALAGDDIAIELGNEDDFPVGFWSAEVMYADGEQVLRDQGGQLPATLRVPRPNKTEARKLECLIVMKDVLGNQAQKKIENIMQLVNPEDAEAEKADKQDEWVSEF